MTPSDRSVDRARRPRRRLGARVRVGLVAVVSVLVVAMLGGCTDGGAGGTIPTPSVGADDQLYISIGDSYAAGYQPQSPTLGSTSQNGFAYQVVAKAAMKGTVLRLVNYGCSGETSTQIVSQNGCRSTALGPGAPTYPNTPQATAAVALMKARPSSVTLVTIVMGGNDVQPCLKASNPQSCVEQAIPVVERNVSGLTAAVRSAVGPSAKIVGLTYPDPYLGEYLQRTPAAIRTASMSRLLFKTYLNPALKTAYTRNGAEFVDITAISGAYDSLDQTTTLSPYGTLPTAVAKACQLTFYCQYQDVHPTTAGYALIADRVLAAAKL